jgi:hypothetical protein
VRIPTFSRHSDTDTTHDRPTAATGSTVARPDDATTTHFTTAGAAAERAGRADAKRQRAHDRGTGNDRDREPAVTGPKPRASLMATLGLILGVASALLVLSGPLLGYGIGLAVLALVVSLAGVFATRRRHVAGKSDALIGMALSLAAIVVGVLALTGSLSWLGTDMQPVNSLREWLDARFVDRF